MGLMRFLTPRRELLTPQAIERAYIAGMDEIPWPSRFVGTDDGLIVDRPVGESGNLYIPWKVEGHPEVTLSTASLMEREPPYLLEVELARGTLNRVRNHVATWELAGMPIAPEQRQEIERATLQLAKAVTHQDDPAAACDLAREALRMAVHLTTALGQTVAREALQVRRQTGRKLTTLFGADLGKLPLKEAEAKQFVEAFNAAVLPLAWQQVEAREAQQDWTLSDRQLEWCQARGLRTISGPLLKFDRTGLPDWLYLWEDDEEQATKLMLDFVRGVVGRYKGRVHLWQAAAGMNAGGVLSLSVEQQLRIAIAAVEIVRKLDPRTPVLVTFDQPWGEFIARQEVDLPWQFADALIRSDLGLAGIGISINVGYHPRGTQTRDLLEFGRQLDRWGLLGLPLLASCCAPGGKGADSSARLNDRPMPTNWPPEQQAEWIGQYFPLLLSKTCVQAVLWNQLRDDAPHDRAHAGLIDAEGKAKPALAELSRVRKAYLA